MRDAISNIKFVDANTATSGQIGQYVDKQGFNSVGFLVKTSGGTTTGNMKIEESEDSTTWTEVPENVTFGDGLGVITVSGHYKTTYTGYKRYVRFVVEAGGDADVFVTSIASYPSGAPVE